MNPFDNFIEELRALSKEAYLKGLADGKQAGLAENYTAVLNRKEVSKMLGVDPNTFDSEYRYADGFPGNKEKNLYPRDAVLEWLKNH